MQSIDGERYATLEEKTILICLFFVLTFFISTTQVLEASSPVTPNAPGGQSVEPDEEKLKARREFLARIMKKALRKSSNTSDDESHVVDDGNGDETDTEQHEQLPHDQDTAIDKRTPIKRKKSAVQLVDDKKMEQLSQKQSSEPPKQQQHRHHHHRQQLPRKLSFMQLREIAETSHQKTEQTSDEIKPIETSNPMNANVEPKDATDKNAHANDDEYNKVNVVSERRALRRQQNARESDGSISLQTSFSDAMNYDIINEKPKSIEKPPRTKSPLQRNSPEIFKFDSKSTKSTIDAYEPGSSRESNENGMNQTQISAKDKSPKKDSVADSQSKNPSPTASFQLNSPNSNDIELNVSSSASSPQKSNESCKIFSSKKLSQHSTPSPQQSPLPSPDTKSEKSEKSEKVSKHSSDDILNKPIKKLNSFLALVKEAVHSKKDQSQPPPQPAPPPSQQQQQQQDIQIDISPSHDLVSRVRLFIDDSNSVSISESIKTTTESVTSSKLTCYESLRRLRHAEQPKPKRQDSQASIWSENIPVITISKSESNECILERDNDDVELSDSKK